MENAYQPRTRRPVQTLIFTHDQRRCMGCYHPGSLSQLAALSESETSPKRFP